MASFTTVYSTVYVSHQHDFINRTLNIDSAHTLRINCILHYMFTTLPLSDSFSFSLSLFCLPHPSLTLSVFLPPSLLEPVWGLSKSCPCRRRSCSSSRERVHRVTHVSLTMSLTIPLQSALHRSPHSRWHVSGTAPPCLHNNRLEEVSFAPVAILYCQSLTATHHV